MKAMMPYVETVYGLETLRSDINNCYLKPLIPLYKGLNNGNYAREYRKRGTYVWKRLYRVNAVRNP